PVPDAGRDTSICFSTTATLNGNGGASYSWNPASSFANPAGRNQVVRPQITTTYWLHVEDANGCRSIRPDSITVTVLEPVIADAGADTIIAIGQPLQLEGSGSGTIFQWTPPAGLSNPSIRNPIALLNNHITYTLKVTNSAGCSDEDAISIKVYKGNDIYVATAFTPNNDGRNDLLLAVPAGIATFKYFKVYNRWGELVFETSDFRKGWDGRIKGLPQETGTFIWMAEGIDYLGNKIFRKGTTTLMR
ncbi:MAG TPA: gliding motility-associated C-terminal domain-containing protein, partial [Flavisolibacter sp.]